MIFKKLLQKFLSLTQNFFNPEITAKIVGVFTERVEIFSAQGPPLAGVPVLSAMDPAAEDPYY